MSKVSQRYLLKKKQDEEPFQFSRKILDTRKKLYELGIPLSLNSDSIILPSYVPLIRVTLISDHSSSAILTIDHEFEGNRLMHFSELEKVLEGFELYQVYEKGNCIADRNTDGDLFSEKLLTIKDKLLFRPCHCHKYPDN